MYKNNYPATRVILNRETKYCNNKGHYRLVIQKVLSVILFSVHVIYTYSNVLCEHAHSIVIKKKGQHVIPIVSHLKCNMHPIYCRYTHTVLVETN